MSKTTLRIALALVVCFTLFRASEAGACTPNYQPVSFTPVGAFQVNYYFPERCEHIVAENVTWHDQNECPESADYTTCHYYVNATQYDHLCCYFYWCGGQTSC